RATHGQNSAYVSASPVTAATAVDVAASANTRHGTGNRVAIRIASPSPNIAHASSSVVAKSATSSTPAGSTPVVRTAAAITKPITNHGTSGAEEAPSTPAAAPPARRSRVREATYAPASSETRPSLIVVATATASAPAA